MEIQVPVLHVVHVRDRLMIFTVFTKVPPFALISCRLPPSEYFLDAGSYCPATKPNPTSMKGVYSLGSLVPKIASSCWVAPNAAVVGNVIMKDSSNVWFGATIRGDQPEPITIGARTNIQDGSVLHSDAGVPLTIGNGVTVGHQAMVHGCTIGDNTLIGIGATILNHSVIGKNCVIGAHTLIPENKSIPDNSLVVGSPGKVVRQLTEEQIQGLKDSAEHYVQNANKFKEEMRGPLHDVKDSFDPKSKL